MTDEFVIDELNSAENLMSVLENDYAGQVPGSAEYLAMRALAGEISSALEGSWMSAADRTRVWLAANSQNAEGKGRRFLHLPSTRTILTGGAAVALSAVAGYALLHRHRKVVVTA
jgi:hypothetical protein